MTSSSGLTPASTQHMWSAAVPFTTATAFATPEISASLEGFDELAGIGHPARVDAFLQILPFTAGKTWFMERREGGLPHQRLQLATISCGPMLTALARML